MDKLKTRKEALLGAAGKAAPSKSNVTDFISNDDYKQMAIEYLQGVDYISPDEIEGIVESNFINYDSAKQAYEVIKQTF